jgi:DNA-3-methyladenine glycosylase II
MGDEEVIAELTKVKGIGRWTAEMFLIFTLGREDVFSFGDLGLRRGLERLYGKSKVRTDAQVRAITEQWSPHRSYGSLALWYVKDENL